MRVRVKGDEPVRVTVAYDFECEAEPEEVIEVTEAEWRRHLEPTGLFEIEDGSGRGEARVPAPQSEEG